MIQIDSTLPPPARREHVRRLTDELKNLSVGSNALVDPKTAACLKEYLRRLGREWVQRAEGEMIRIWRLS